MIDKPEYFLFLHNGTSSVDYFKTATMTSRPNEAIVWSRMKENPVYLVNGISEIQTLLLSNPMAVFFGPELMTELKLEEYPCKIIKSALKLTSVSLN